MANPLALSLIVGAMFGLIYALFGYAIYRFKDAGKSWIVFLDSDTGKASVKRLRLKGEGFRAELPNGKKGQFLTSAKARYTTMKGSLFVMHPVGGWNLTAPSRTEAMQDPAMAKLIINDPEAYYYAIMHNDTRDSLQANESAEPWFAKLAPFALIALVLILGMVAWLVNAQRETGAV